MENQIDRVLRKTKKIDYKQLAEPVEFSDTGEVWSPSKIEKVVDLAVEAEVLVLPKAEDRDEKELECLVKEQENLRENLLRQQRKGELEQKLKKLRIGNEEIASQLSARTATVEPKSDDKQVTLKKLRQDETLTRKVDKMMAQMRVFSDKNSESSESISSSSEDSDEDSESSDDHRSRKTRKCKSRRKKKTKGSDRKAKGRKSGKDSKPTTKVIFPQKWPHSELNIAFVDSNIMFEKLSIDEFVAGYATILQGLRKNSKEYSARLEHLVCLMYLAGRYEWKAVLSFHGAVLLEIEMGRASWGQSFSYLEARTLHGHLKDVKSSELGQTNSTVFFCKDFQKGKCRFTRDHRGSIKGESRFLKHICAACWLSKRTQQPHAEGSDKCPLARQTPKA